MTSEKRIVCIVTPLYNEQDMLPRFEDAVKNSLMASDSAEIRVLFVDDGSTDDSWRAVKDICARDSRFQGIRLSRNFGAHVAITAGLAFARGDALAVLACDLQDPPEVVLQFIERWKSGAKIVWGRRRSRRDGIWRGAASAMFEQLLRRFAMPRGSKFATGSFLLLDRSVADCFNQFREHHRITFALVAWTGFAQDVVEYDRRPRAGGRSGWGFGQLVKAIYDAFIGFSLMPIRAITLLGIGVSLLAVALLVYLVFTYITGDPQPGWTSQMLGLSFFFGIQFLLMGIMGEYLYRIYTEVVRRPLYFVSETTIGVPVQRSDAA
jgi:glycosyltransferase involved in cell wall biosynthesis